MPYATLQTRRASAQQQVHDLTKKLKGHGLSEPLRRLLETGLAAAKEHLVESVRALAETRRRP